MDIVKKIIYFAVGIIMTVGFVVIGMSIYNKSRDSISSANAQYDSIVGRYADIAYAMYEGSGATASGTEVKELILGLTDPGVSIYVKNGRYISEEGEDKEGVRYNCRGNVCGCEGEEYFPLSSAKDYLCDRSKAKFYINSNATFDAEVRRDENGLICALEFVQRRSGR